MEFEFIRNTLMGKYYVKPSMGHEILGRWLEEEIGKDRQKIQQVDELLEAVKYSPLLEHKYAGCEISLIIQGDEVTVQENVLSHGDVLLEDSELNYYNSESTASCGLQDFSSLFKQWQDFLQSR
ncbi:YacL family protein [Vibrio hepatarius]|uniref:UPF0231 family protein n=1 Tax=Vibrio hepatarius TaxID=171383 RepID=UPI001C0872AD|nr:YacL family protein [Vibrio hepatarius]MBU2896357.1 YacL family protein [Vibrio hepatarius]